jgi:ADP-ribose pyrophosphatase YjhB (NUDIX family)
MPSRDRTPAAEQGAPADGSTTRPSNATNDANTASGTGETPRRRSRRRRRPRHRNASTRTTSTEVTATDGDRSGAPSGGNSPARDTAAGGGAPDGGGTPADSAGRSAGNAVEPSSGAGPGGASGGVAGSGGGTAGPGGGGRRRKRRRRRRGPGAAGNAAATPAGGTATGTAPSEDGAPTARSAAKKRRKRRVDTPPPGQIRGRRRTRSGRIEEVSSGGLVVDVRDDGTFGVLIGKHDRRGRLIWSLPKGHVELGETLEQTAVREIEEETGVSSEVRHRLGEVDYWFMLHGEKIHKTVHHFLLRFLDGELSDRDREVVEVAWVPLDDIPQRLAHPDERRLVAQVPDLLAKSGA